MATSATSSSGRPRTSRSTSSSQSSCSGSDASSAATVRSRAEPASRSASRRSTSPSVNSRTVEPAGSVVTVSLRAVPPSTPRSSSPLQDVGGARRPSGPSTTGAGWPALDQRIRVIPRSASSAVCSKRATPTVAYVSSRSWSMAASRPRSTSTGPLVAVDGDPAQQGPQLTHRGGCFGVVADDVADDEHGGPAGLEEGVVPVTADAGARGGRRVAGGGLGGERLERRRQQAPLQRLGALPLLAEQPHVVQ